MRCCSKRNLKCDVWSVTQKVFYLVLEKQMYSSTKVLPKTLCRQNECCFLNFLIKNKIKLSVNWKGQLCCWNLSLIIWLSYGYIENAGQEWGISVTGFSENWVNKSRLTVLSRMLSLLCVLFLRYLIQQEFVSHTVRCTDHTIFSHVDKKYCYLYFFLF